MRNLRIGLWILVALAAVGFTVLLMKRPADPAVQQLEKIGAPFSLTDAKGKSFSSDKLSGRPHAIFFGFTHCPDVCPTTLARLTKLRQQLGKGGETFDIVLISVDPERDTPQDLDRYVSMFPGPVTALTGTAQEIAEVTKAFGIYSKKVPDNQGGYTVDHSSQVLLFNRDGSFGGTITFEEADEPALQKLRNIADS